MKPVEPEEPEVNGQGGDGKERRPDEERTGDPVNPFQWQGEYFQTTMFLIELRYRARTTSFLVQLWTWWQCGQLRRGRLSFVPSHSDSSTVLPVGARRPVDGQRTRIRLIAEPAVGFAARVRSNLVIRGGKLCGLFQGHKATSAFSRGRQ